MIKIKNVLGWGMKKNESIRLKKKLFSRSYRLTMVFILFYILICFPKFFSFPRKFWQVGHEIKCKRLEKK